MFLCPAKHLGNLKTADDQMFHEHFYNANLQFTINVCVLQVFKSRDLENEPKTYSSRWYAQDFLDVGDQNLAWLFVTF